MDKLRKKLAPLLDMWGKLTPVQKASVTLMGILAVVALIVSVSIASRPQYSILFSNLSQTDASSIVDKLKESKVPYQLSGGGSVIEVPSKDVYDLRLQMAGAGLPQGGSVGFEIFDKSNFGMTEFTQRLNYQRALQGELERTIGELSSVTQARVHLAIPEKNIYSDSEKQEEPTASVVLKLRSGMELSPDQVASITHLVSAAVEGMKPGNVAVVDTAGNLLSDSDFGGISSSGIRLSSSQLQMQNAYEDQIAKNLQAMLERVLGQGKVIVRVNARLNFDSKQTDSEIYEPASGNQGVLNSEETTEETYKGSPRRMPNSPALSNSMGGSNGAVTNGNAVGDNYSRTNSSSHYDVTKHIEHVTQAPGKIDRLSVAVLMDGNITPAVSNTVQQAVSAAAGLDFSRGDQVTVQSLPFDTTALTKQDQEMQKAANYELFMNLGKWLAAIILAAFFLLFVRSLLNRWNPAEVTENYTEPLPLNQMEAFEMNSSEPASPSESLRMPEPNTGVEALNEGEPDDSTISEKETPTVPAGSVTLQKITQMAHENPTAVANLIRSWVNDTERQDS